MAMAFDSFKGYLYYLLPGPLKKVGKNANGWFKLMAVIGRLMDESKIQLVWAREQSMVLSCSPELLELHGAERDMPRLKDEELEAYRERLIMKGIIARQAGTNEGIKTAVKALGYDNSYVEPYYLVDPDRWAEFIVWLRTSKKEQISLNDLSVIDVEVMKVKPASALPNYGVDFGSSITMESAVTIGTFMEPRCGTFRCGQYPPQGGELS